MKNLMSQPFWLTVGAVVIGVTLHQLGTTQLNKMRTSKPTASESKV